MIDLATALQAAAEDQSGHYPVTAKKLCERAAAEIARLRGALEKIADEPNNTMSNGKAMGEMARIAKAALR